MKNVPRSPMKVGFVLLSSPTRPIPSTRVAVLNMLPLLAERGVVSEVIYAPEHASERPDLTLDPDEIARNGFQVVCFQKVHGPSAQALANALRARGVGTVFLVCDVVDEGMCEVTDATATVTEYLRGLYPPHLHPKIHVVHDGIERPDVVKVQGIPSEEGVMSATLVTSAHLTGVPIIGMPPSWLRVTIVGPYSPKRFRRLREDWWTLQRLSGWHERIAFLRFILSGRVRRVTWTPAGVYDELARADVGIIPIQYEPPSNENVAPLWKRKSENRLTLKMAIGLPVVATPIPAYEPIIEQGVNGHLVNDREGWLAALGSLRSPSVRTRIGEQARRDVLSRYSMQEQCRLLHTVLMTAGREARVCCA